MPNNPFPTSEHLTSITLAYQNTKLIADMVLPPMPVPGKKYTYWSYPKGQLFTVPDTNIGRKSEANQPDFEGEKLTDRVSDRGLLEFIPQDDIEEAAATFDIKGNMTEWLTNLMLLDHEIKTAGLVFNNGTYDNDRKVQLAGSDQFDDGTSKPNEVISDILDTPIMRPNRLVFGQRVWTKFRQHPQIVESVKGTGAKEGMVTRQAVAQLFEVDEVIVGPGFVNTAKKGQAPDIQRVWGKHIAALYIDPVANTMNGGVTFGGTPQFKERMAGEWEDPKPGVEGGTWVKTAGYYAEKIFAPDVGYFIEDAVS